MRRFKTTNGSVVEVRRANEMEGCLLPIKATFRVYTDGGSDNEPKSFTDYPIRHSDPFIKFVDSGVYFYSDGSKQWIDHSPEALGYEEVSDGDV